MLNSVAINLAILMIALSYYQAMAAPRQQLGLTKVFNYQSSMPIKDDRQVSNSNDTTNLPQGDIAEMEAMCWKMINEQSAVTFSLQKEVIDELESEMKNLKMDDDLRESILKITKGMRNSMDEALEALRRNAADEYFDALFDSSEDILYMSALLRNPKLDNHAFLTLVKAVSRLGRNNSALIQEFTEMCSFLRAPRPRDSNSK